MRELLRLWRMAGAELQYPIGDLDFPFTSEELASISSEEASDPKPDDAPVDGGGGEGNHTSTGHSTSSGNQ
jgi:hypothetical protein